MENCYAVRITLPYEPNMADEDHMRRNTVMYIAGVWSRHVNKMVVYEHDDDGANNLHCHIMIEGCHVTKKRLQQLAQEQCALQRRVQGQRATSLMSFRSKEYDGHWTGFAYVTKGKYDPKYIQGWTREEAESWKAAWVKPEEHVKRTPWRVLMDSYNEWDNHPDNRLDPDVEVTPYIITTRVFRFLLRKHDGLYPPQAKTERWFLVTNLCHAYHIPFPQGHVGEWRM